MDTIVRSRADSEPPAWQQGGPGDAAGSVQAQSKPGVEQVDRLFRWMLHVMLLEMFVILVYASQFRSPSEFLSVASVGCLLAAAAAAIAAGVGFLFGLPHALQADSERLAPGSPGDGAGAEAGKLYYRPNTNLDQISDWLTKVLVGVGLTQLGGIREGLGSLTDFVAPAFGLGPQSAVLAAAILALSAVLGFLFGFLWTRLVITGQLTAADRQIWDVVGKLQLKVAHRDEQDREREEQDRQRQEQDWRDARALAVALSRLSPTMPGTPTVLQSELVAALRQASRKAREQIFTMALQRVQENYMRNKVAIEPAIPVYQALIATDIDDCDHQSHAQLGFALSEKTAPDYAEAEREYERAIAIRSRLKQADFLLYEFGRAVVRIDSDRSANAEAGTPERRKQILDDLRAAYHGDDSLKQWVVTHESVTHWLGVNHVALEELTGDKPSLHTPAPQGAG